MCLRTIFGLCLAASLAGWCWAEESAQAPAEGRLSPAEGFAFLRTYCFDCHQEEEPQAELNLARFDTVASLAAEPETWNKVVRRVRAGEMPPEGGPLPEQDQREQFVAWVEYVLYQAACEDGVSPGPALVRRLNRAEYAATIRDLLNIHIDAGQGLPADGAGGEGFDNAAETLFLSPLHAEKYLEAARAALGYAFSDPQARRRVLTAEPSGDLSPEEAARRVLANFLPRAFRRPASEEELETYNALFRAAYEREGAFEPALQFTLEGVLISPHFLFRIEELNPAPEPRLVGDYEMASRLSYFLWGSMPDDELFRLAKEGKLNNPQTLEQQVRRMLGSATGRRRNRDSDSVTGGEKVHEFAQNFVEQWLGTRALGREFKPDPSVARRYDSELEGGMKYEPVMFFQDIVTENRSLLNLLDSDFTYLNNRLAQHYGIRGDFREQPRRAELPKDSHRGGLLGMAAVLAVSSHPHRTSPVLRGKWVLETLLGEPPPPPPPNVPALEDDHDREKPATLRERLERHRRDPACASCHSRIDPLGFGLENYDVLGRWRTEEFGRPIDNRGELPDGTTFAGPEELKRVLLDRKDQFIRHLTAKMLGYALGRSLTAEDYCAVDEIAEQVRQNDYSSHALILGVVKSVPFRYKAKAIDAED